jgi:hypothetical protein
MRLPFGAHQDPVRRGRICGLGPTPITQRPASPSVGTPVRGLIIIKIDRGLNPDPSTATTTKPTTGH